jgi:hypothetical protein
MLAIKGYSDGTKVMPLDPTVKLPTGEVMIVLSEAVEKEQAKSVRPGTLTHEEFMALAGTWQDDRSAEEIIREIYESRTVNMEPPDFERGKE